MYEYEDTKRYIFLQYNSHINEPNYTTFLTRSRDCEVAGSTQGSSHIVCLFLLTGEDQPECTTCQCPLTVMHILVDCFNFNDTRNKYFVASSMEELFRTADVQVLDFIKETHFYSKL